jgi:Ca2+-binding EF-hand superfamily protein
MMKNFFALAVLLLVLPSISRGEEEKKSLLSELKKKAMKTLDTDGDGKITDSDKESLFNKLKGQLLNKFDTDKDGKLSPEEKEKAKSQFRKLQEKSEGGDKPSALFKKFDADGDGKLSDAEKKEAQSTADKLLKDEKAAEETKPAKEEGKTTKK